MPWLDPLQTSKHMHFSVLVLPLASRGSGTSLRSTLSQGFWRTGQPQAAINHCWLASSRRVARQDCTEADSDKRQLRSTGIRHGLGVQSRASPASAAVIVAARPVHVSAVPGTTTKESLSGQTIGPLSVSLLATHAMKYKTQDGMVGHGHDALFTK